MGLLTPFPLNDDPGTANVMNAIPVNEVFVKNDQGVLQGTGVTMAQLKTMAGQVQTSLVGPDGKIASQYLPAPPVVSRVGQTGEYADLLNAPALAAVALSGSYDDLRDKPALFSGAYADLTGAPELFSGAWKDLSGVPAFKRIATTADYADLINTPALFSGRWADITGKPVFAAVATSGSWADITGKPVLFDGTWASLSGKPDIPAAQVQADWNASSGMAAIKNKPALFDGTWQSLLNKPTFATVASTGRFADLLGAPVMPKVIETLSGTTSTTAGATLGVVDFVFAQTYTNVPHVNPALINAAAGVMMTVTNVTNKGCRVTCYQRNAVTLLAVEVLLAATVAVGGVNVGLLVVSRD